MPDTYRVLLRVAMRHQYFADGVLRELLVLPTPATAERLRRAGWLFKSQPDGFTLLFSDKPPLASVEHLFPLLFRLQPLDASFHQYSNLPLAPDQALAHSRRAGTLLTYFFGQPAGTTAARLHHEPVASALNQMALRPLVFGHKLRAVRPASAKLWAYPNGKKPLKTYPVPAAASALKLDLRPWGNGRYELKIGADSFVFYADDELAANHAWGMLELTDQVLASTAGRTYTLAFAARRAHVQYQVSSRLPLPPGTLAIRGGARHAFAAVQPAPGFAASFRSKKAIALSFRPLAQPYQLFVLPSGPSSTNRPQVLHSALPHGHIGALRPEETGTEVSFVSEIFVYL